MPWWRKFLALLGLTDDARVHVRASGIDIVITGEPKLVRRVLEAVKEELEGRRKRSKKGVLPVKFDTDSHMVLPSELDDMDSPYIIPEHRSAGAAESLLPGGTQVAMDEDIVGERLATRDVDPPAERTTIDAEQKRLMPVPSISASSPTTPETTTGERDVSFSIDSVTDGGSSPVSEEFTDSGSERGTDPDLSAEAQQLPKHMLPRTES